MVVPTPVAAPELTFYSEGTGKIGDIATRHPELKDREKDVADVCKAPGATPAAVAGLITVGAERALAYLVDQADKALQAEMAKYTATYSASSAFQLYDKAPSLKAQCFRMVRTAKVDGKDIVALDFVGVLELKGDKNVLTARPLRLYSEAAAAKTDASGKVGIALSLRLDSYWREAQGGNLKAPAWSGTVLSESLEYKGVPYVYKSYSQETKPGTIGALPPWSPEGRNWTVATLTVAETGNPPWLLENLAKLFHDKKDDIKTKLTEAATAVLPAAP
ncbi:hypothetical protein [Magnetospirillum sp. UT-4]|uniref:hypothetical protein n=1 Tax=Magnetospirillum sp. UT-4 TaxID=2681467 RepID=UPI001571C949|nr:hypothetical protein [Magnetospirillum sp. UT-4]